MQRWLLLGWRMVAGVHLVFLTLWIVQTIAAGGPEGDWWTFREAARRWFEGAGVDLYIPEKEPFYRFIYPPYALWFFMPVAYLPEVAAYLTITAVQLGAMLASIGLLIREFRPSDDIRDTLVISFVGSAAFAWEIILGQSGGVFLLGYTLAILAWRRGASGWAGLALGVLGIKPHWTVAPAGLLPFFDRRAWGAFALVGVGLVLSSVPLGIELWQGFLDVATGQVDLVDTYHGHERHNLTVRGFLVAQNLGIDWVHVLWLAALVPTSRALIAVWRADVDPLRKVSALILFTVSTNYYVNIYDAVVLLIPVLDWTSGPDRLPLRWSRVGSVAIAVAWLWDARTWLWPILLPIEPGPFCLSGVVAMGLLIAQGVHAWRLRSEA